MTKPIFQRRHFEYLAETLSGVSMTPTDWAHVVRKLQESNPKFNPQRFWAAVQKDKK